MDKRRSSRSITHCFSLHYIVNTFITNKMYLVPFTKSHRRQPGIGPGVKTILLLLVLGTSITDANAKAHAVGEASCATPAQTLAGAVCGTRRASYLGRTYASFRGVPYTRQPLGDLRFAPPQPLDPWDGFFNASVEGPICPQSDSFYGPMMQPRSTGEDCLHANVHVPAASLPEWGQECRGSACLPVLVFWHGGSFYCGSGDSDMNGPEYLMDNDHVVITMNYRLGAFGFLSLNSSSVPGNAGLRDMIAGLQWVQKNARAFGGNPSRVTVMGQSAGASDVHILTLSEAANGLFQNAILMGGTATGGFFSTLPSYAQYVKDSFLKELGINSTDPDEIHSQLIALPYQALVDANHVLLESLGLAAFGPVVESQFDGVTRIIDDDPDVLLAKGRGNSYPLIVGFADNECGSLISVRLKTLDIVERIKKNASAILPPKLLYSISPEEQAAAAKQMTDRYFNGPPSLDKYIPSCSDSLFVYPALKLAEARLTAGGAPLYLYQFSYGSPSSPVKQAFGINYKGAGHLEDLTYVMRVNSILKDTVLSARDEEVKDWMTDIISNFVVCNDATCEEDSSLWPRVSRETGLQYQAIRGPKWALSPLTREQRAMVQFFDQLYGAKSYPIS